MAIMPLKIFQGHSRSLTLVRTESRCNIQQFSNMSLGILSYRLPDIADCYPDFHCGDGGASTECVILEKPLNRRLRIVA